MRPHALMETIEAAHVALEQGDILGAKGHLAAARALDRRAVEVRVLEANVALLDGDTQKALSLFRELANDVGHASHWINVAHILFHSNQDAEAALSTLESAWEALEDDDDLIAAVLLKAEAHLELGGRSHFMAARAALDELDSLTLDPGEYGPELLIRLAETRIGCDQPDRAKALAELLAGSADADTSADGFYLLGHIADYVDDAAARAAAWARVREADVAKPRPRWALSIEDADRIATETLATLPARAQTLLGAVPIFLDDAPSAQQVADGIDPRVLGLFSGTPYSDGDFSSSGTALTAIHLFLRNLERDADNAEELADQIRITVLHETAHFFGLDDGQLHAMGLG